MVPSWTSGLASGTGESENHGIIHATSVLSTARLHAEQYCPHAQVV